MNRRTVFGSLALALSAMGTAIAGRPRTVVTATEDGNIKIITPRGVTVTIGSPVAGEEITVDSGAYRTSFGPLGITVQPTDGASAGNPITSIQNGQWAMNDNQGNYVVISQRGVELGGSCANIFINGERRA